MSAIPTHFQFPGIMPARRDHWVTVAQLSAVSGIPKRTLAWACTRPDRKGELAHCHRWRKKEGGGPEILEINLTFAPDKYRLAFAKNDAQEHGEGHILSDAQLARTSQLATLMEEIEALLAHKRPGVRDNEVIESFLATRRLTTPSTPSLRSYFRHKARWLAGGRKLSAIADGRAIAGGGVTVEMSEDAFAFFCSAYLSEEKRQSSVCWDRANERAKEMGWAFPSLPTVMRALRKRVPKAKIIEMREGPEARRNKANAHIQRDWSKMDENERWVSDHCLLDVLGVDDLANAPARETGKPNRMWLTTWMDERSRYICHFRVHRGPNTEEVLASFHDAVLKEGIPKNILIDNGKEYRCRRFAGGRDWREHLSKVAVDETAVRPVLYDLGVTPHYALPYGARSKIIEPWHHHCIKEHFSKWVPGYCGGSPEERPEQLAEIVKKWHKTGEGLMPWSKLIELLGEVIDGYNRKAHESLAGNCPAFIRQQTMAAKRVADPRALAKIFQDKRTLTIGAMGIQIDGAAFGLGNPDIAARQGEKVRVHLDRMNAGRIYVYDLAGIFITTAENDGRCLANATPADVKEAQKFIARHNKLAEEMATNMPILTAIDPVAAIALGKKAHRGAQQPAADSTPANYKPIDWSARADNAGDAIPFRPVRPAPDGSKIIQTQVEQGTDSPDSGIAAKLLPDNIFDAFAAG